MLVTTAIKKTIHMIYLVVSLRLYTLGFTRDKRNGTLETLQRVNHLLTYTGGI